MQNLEALTASAGQLPAECRLQAPDAKTRYFPLAANPWSGTDRHLVAFVRQMIDGSPPVVDGPPLDARRSQSFTTSLADDIEQAYSATYLAADGSPVSVYAVRFKDASLATLEPPGGTTRRRAAAEKRIVEGAAVVLVSSPRRTGCFEAVSRHVSADAGQDRAQLIGLWRGTSTCTDRVAAPACNDEQAVYEFTAGSKPGVVHWLADKMVDGKRVNMGELDLTYDSTERCWKAEFTSPRVKVVWCLTVDGTHMTGTGRQLPGNVTVRKVDLRKQ